jgi:hypothetical protein
MSHTIAQLVALVRTAKALKAEAEKADEIAKSAIYAANKATGKDEWESAEGTVKLVPVAGRVGFDQSKAQKYLTSAQYDECVTRGKPSTSIRFTMAVTRAA